MKVLKLLPTWLPIIIAATVIVAFSHLLDDSDRIGEKKVLLIQEKFVAYLVIVNCLLVLYNTIGFVLESLNAAKKADDYTVSANSKKWDRFYTMLFVLFNFSTMLISMGIAGCYFLKLYSILDLHWGYLFKVSEYLTVMMFFFFIVADWAILMQYKISKNSNELKLSEVEGSHGDIKSKIKHQLNELEGTINFTKNAIWLVDLTGLIGIVLILWITHNMNGRQDHIFIEGFAVGAIAFHIFFTQINLTILSFLEKREDNIAPVIIAISPNTEGG
jgi:hypothetical protein